MGSSDGDGSSHLFERPDAHLSYRRRGEGPAVLFIQGAGARGEVWRPQLEPLSARYATVAFDNRGLGKSRILSGELTLEAMADDALAIMDHLGIERFHLVGHSMGGLIAQEVALRAPARARTLSLLCTFARGRQATRMTADMLLIGLRTRIGTRAARRRAFLELVVPPALLARRGAPALAQELGELFGRDLADQPAIIMKQLRAMSRYDASGRLAGLRIPTLVMSAEHDRIARPSFGRELAAAIPGARFVELPGLSHTAPIDAAGQVNALLEAQFQQAD
ncbi:MAG TPA: alpha/beta fold hydrolase [Polyangia bacterium]|nr:alpha/beta fold hydrolase [Polyangia bacterium]